MEEFHFSEIIVLECATLLDKELLHRYFPTFLIVIVGHYSIVLKFHRSLGKNGKNILKGKYQKEGIKYEGGGGRGR